MTTDAGHTGQMIEYIQGRLLWIIQAVLCSFGLVLITANIRSSVSRVVWLSSQLEDPVPFPAGHSQVPEQTSGPA